MPSVRATVAAALKALLVTALPQATVLGLAEGDGRPDPVPPGGLAELKAGDPGSPEIDLSPLVYTYDHRFIVELTAYQSASQTSAQALDAMLAAIGQAVAADRTLGGLCIWLETEAPPIDDDNADGESAMSTADLALIANYTTTNPLD